ncbi:MAG TPA: PEP-CTERM sorting domain-containing protein [Lacunisphaera sp.]
MKIISRLLMVILSATAGVLAAPAQTIIQTVRVEISNANSTPGIVDGDRFDIAFSLNFGATDAQADLANFQNSTDIVAPASISITRLGTNTGTWDPGSLGFNVAHLLASNTATYDTLGFTFESNTPDVPVSGYTFTNLGIQLWTFVNLGLVQDAPALNSPLSTFLGGTVIDYAGFEQSYGSFGFNTGSVGFNVIPSAIPEPSTYAAFAGAVVLGLAAWRRRGRSLMAARDH